MPGEFTQPLDPLTLTRLENEPGDTLSTRENLVMLLVLFIQLCQELLWLGIM